MKTCCCIALLLALMPASHAQKYPRINFDISLLRYGPEKGIGDDIAFKSKWLPFSAVKIGMALNAHSLIHAGLRRQPDQYTLDADDANRPGLSLSAKGFEATLGYEYRINLVHSFALLAEAGLFYDHAQFTGSDFRYAGNGSGLSINCRREYMGVYPELKISYSLSRHVSIMAGTRLRAGTVRYKQGYLQPSELPYASGEGTAISFDSLSNLSFRYQL